MKLSELTVDIGTVSSHHKVCNDLNILFLENEYIRSVESLCVFDPDEYTGLLEILYEFLPRTQCNDRGGYIYLPVDKGVQRGRGRTHTDIRHFPDGIPLNLIEKLVTTGHRLGINQIRVSRRFFRCLGYIYPT